MHISAANDFFINRYQARVRLKGHDGINVQNSSISGVLIGSTYLIYLVFISHFFLSKKNDLVFSSCWSPAGDIH
jgi:hypothetical protein